MRHGEQVFDVKEAEMVNAVHQFLYEVVRVFATCVSLSECPSSFQLSKPLRELVDVWNLASRSV